MSPWPSYGRARFAVGAYAAAGRDLGSAPGLPVVCRTAGVLVGVPALCPAAYRYVVPDMLLQTPAAQELLPGGELSEQSWWP